MNADVWITQADYIAPGRNILAPESELHRVITTVVQEKEAPADTPERRGPQLHAIGVALRNVVSEPHVHSVEGKVAKW
jgi:hypothetical protein